MEQYSIKEVENLSGIKAHTLRIWEKRYAIAVPSRSDTNIRYYSADELKKIISVSILNKNGYKISRIAKLSPEELAEIIQDLNTNSSSEDFIDQMVICLVNLNEIEFTTTLSRIILKIGFEETVTTVLYPFLDRIGVLWVTKKINPAQEHFISNLIRQKIIVAIDALPLRNEGKSFLFYLREDELHEIGLLFLVYLVKKKGFKTYYLGQSVPIDDVVTTCNIHRPDYLITSIINPSSSQSILQHFTKLQFEFPSEILITGRQTENMDAQSLPGNCHLLPTSDSFRSFLESV